LVAEGGQVTHNRLRELLGLEPLPNPAAAVEAAGSAGDADAK
jgi:hypothetical protein